MMKYPKIQTVFKRDPATKHKTLLEGEFSEPEFEYLANNTWVFTEKVDGTNIRVHWDGERVRFGGRTDNAQIPAFLYERLEELFPPEKMARQFDDEVTLFGEGYGAKIQKGGGKYKPDGVDFVLFDGNCGEMWLRRNSLHEISLSLGIALVPIVGFGPLDAAVERAREGFKSNWGDFPAEGLVMRPKMELLNRRYERIITKVKTKDFQT